MQNVLLEEVVAWKGPPGRYIAVQLLPCHQIANCAGRVANLSVTNDNSISKSSLNNFRLAIYIVTVIQSDKREGRSVTSWVATMLWPEAMIVVRRREEPPGRRLLSEYPSNSSRCMEGRQGSQCKLKSILTCYSPTLASRKTETRSAADR